MPGSLRPLLKATYEQGPGAKAALSACARNRRLQRSGNSQVALSTLMSRTKNRGHRTYAHCNVRGCLFDIVVDEGPDLRFGALNANLSHSARGNDAPDASAHDKRAAGDYWLPPVGLAAVAPSRYLAHFEPSSLEKNDTLRMTSARPLPPDLLNVAKSPPQRINPTVLAWIAGRTRSRPAHASNAQLLRQSDRKSVCGEQVCPVSIAPPPRLIACER